MNKFEFETIQVGEDKKKLWKPVVATALTAGLLLNAVGPTVATAQDLLEKEQEFIVVYKNNSGKLATMNNSEDIEHEFDSIKAMTVSAKPHQMEILDNNPNIAYIEENIKVSIKHDFKVVSAHNLNEKEVSGQSTSTIPAEESQWDIKAMNLSEAFNKGVTGKGVKVAVIDTGISAHKELDIKGGVSTVSYTKSYADDNGHGTHVAGTIGAKRDGAGLVGVAPDSEIFAIKSLDAQGNGYLSDIVAGVDWAIQNKMDVINMSLGTSADSRAMRDIVQKASNSGIIVVGANGNDGVGTPVNYPAKYDSVIAVSSIDSALKISSFSSTGPETEFTAPGSQVVSTYLNGGYAISSGTSMASPHVAGFVALMKQMHPDKSASEIRKELQNYAVDLGDVGRDNFYGYGMLKFKAPAEPELPPVEPELPPTEPELPPTEPETPPTEPEAPPTEPVEPPTEPVEPPKEPEKDTTPPAEVANLKVASLSHNSAELKFTNPKDEDFAKANVYLNGKLVGSTTDGTFKLNNLTALTTYDVKVTTVDKEGNESIGSSLLFKTNEAPDVTPPGEVTSFKVTNATTSSLTVQFAKPTDSDFARVDLYLNDELVGSTTSTSYSFIALDADTTYKITAKTVDKKGNASNGVSLTAKTAPDKDVTPPGEVTGAKASNITATTADLYWTNPKDADLSHVNLYVNGQKIAEVSKNVTNVKLSGLTQNASYTVTLKTVDTNGNESKGTNISIKTPKDTTPPANVTSLKATNIANNSATITWTNPKDADFARNNIYVNGQLVGTVGKDTNGVNLSGLISATNYTVVVKSVDLAGNESKGSTVKFKTSGTWFNKLFGN